MQELKMAEQTAKNTDKRWENTAMHEWILYLGTPNHPRANALGLGWYCRPL